MAKNIGEYDELRIKLRLIELRDSKNPVTIDGKQMLITSVKLEKEFLSLPPKTDLQNMSDNEIETLANKVGAGKAKGGYKADVIINGDGYSVKSHRSAPPAIVNHTPRWGWVRICKQLNVDIKPLDKMVEKYFEMRSQGVTTEDVSNSNPNSTFADNKEILKPILNYFLFKGTGSGDSKFPAEYVLDCENPYNTDSWVIKDESNTLDEYWDKLIFSMRNKGFESYPYSRDCDKWKTPASAPWAKEFDGTLKGSLHVRVG